MVPQRCITEFGKLRDYVESLGGHLRDGWGVMMIRREAWKSAGAYDRYYMTPSGRRYDSKVSPCSAMRLACIARAECLHSCHPSLCNEPPATCGSQAECQKRHGIAALRQALPSPELHRCFPPEKVLSLAAARILTV